MVSTAPGTDGQSATRARLVEAAAALFSRNGYSATGVKAVLLEASAPYGSLYHWFPGGKQQLGVAALEYGGSRYRELLESVYPEGKGVVEATAASFVMASELLEQTDFDLHAGVLQNRDAAARHFGERIAHRNHDAGRMGR